MALIGRRTFEDRVKEMEPFAYYRCGTAPSGEANSYQIYSRHVVGVLSGVKKTPAAAWRDAFYKMNARRSPKS